MKLAIVTAFWQREEVTRAFCQHYRDLRDELASRVDVLLCAAHSQDEAYLDRIDASGWETVFAENRPLVQKFNAAVDLVTRDFDAVLVTGSDDFIDAAYVLWAVEQVRRGYELIGARDIYFWRRSTGEGIHWPGYHGPREGEPIGAGRVLSAELLDRWMWKPWPDCGDRGLDGAMWHRAEVVSARTLCAPLVEIGGMMVDVKDEGNLTAWQSIVHAEGSRRCEREEIEGDSFSLPFSVDIDESPVPWFAPDGAVCLAMVAKCDTESWDGLRRSLFSCRGLCDRAVVLLDSRTPRQFALMLRSLGCQVIDYDWRSDFAHARNTVAEACEGSDWLVVLDADEEIQPGNMRDVMRTTDAEGVEATVLVWADEGRLVQPRRTRAYRYGSGTWEKATHNQLVGLASWASSTAQITTSYAGKAEERALRQIPALMQAVQADPEDTHAMMYLARALRILGQIEAAAFYAQRCVEIAPDDPATCSAWVELGAAQGQQGDFGAAFETFVQAARLHSGFPSIWQNLAALSLSAWAGSMRARSAYDGIPHNAPSDLEARISEAARMLHLPIGIEEGGDAVSG